MHGGGGGGGSQGLGILPVLTTDLQGDLQAHKRACLWSDATLGSHLQDDLGTQAESFMKDLKT